MAEHSEELKEETEKTPQGSPGNKGSSWKKFFTTVSAHWRLKGALVLMLLVAGMYGWKNVAIRKVEKEKQKQTIYLSERVSQVVTEKNKALLRLTAIPLSWVVRQEMPKGNYDNIDQYFRQIIREDRFKVILLAAPDGKIVVATDKRMEGAAVSKFYPASVLEQHETTVTLLTNGELMAVTPVLGLTAKLGVLILVYPPQNVALEPAGK